MSQDCAFSDVTDSALELCDTGMHEPSGVTTIEGEGLGANCQGSGGNVSMKQGWVRAKVVREES